MSRILAWILLYTSTVTRLILTALGLSLFLTTATNAQVRITIPPQRYTVHEEIHAKVENMGHNAVTFCVEFGQTSMKGDEVESTPSPFLVQRNDHGKWGTLMVGPDAGSGRAPVVLEAAHSKEFAFRLNDSGKMRLRLSYRRGSIPELDCHAPKGLKLASSPVFSVE